MEKDGNVNGACQTECTRTGNGNLNTNPRKEKMMTKEDRFGIVWWENADLEDILEQMGIEPNQDNVAKLRHQLEDHGLTDVMIEAGWNFISDAVHWLFKEERK